ncbi:metalloregulator ArsR/SmtB family transcription factor [Paenibacillus sp. JX-17]|uniref:Metalloregulator ArsR/SmtB family transcription factor n=1 Tax=Paenibacillus lacisoli TaxID=3064525 RepID=A0ABT9CD13_9BACL|nr:metalloregulator ArsR/SmtB family transcription factor [Paenibacillus sp. JX-17]MDO7907159.1 metalloregulator ArsR/SmtB family transcription factor [Paenibacillus sp. JX-17]
MTIEQQLQSTAQDEQLVKIFRALADMTRIDIVRTLYQHNREMACGEVGEICAVSKSNASYHFRTLREAGLTTTRKEAQTKYVKLNHDTFNRLMPGFLDTL